VDGGKELLRLKHGTGRFEGITWLNGADLLVINTPGAPEDDTANDDAHDDAGGGTEAGGDEAAEADGEATDGEATDGETTAEGDSAKGDSDAEDAAKDAQATGITLEGPERAVWRVPTGGGAPTRLFTLSETQYLSWPAVDAKAEHAAFAARIDDEYVLAVLDIAQGNLRHLAVERGPVEQPLFSPDGKHLAFTQGGGTRQEIMVSPIGLESAKALTQNRVRDRYPRFSADGTRIWFETLDDDPNFPRARNVVVLASVPFSP
jgi:hypothetical protein